MSEKYELHHMTWKEIEEAFSNDPVVLVPFGSMEEHGPHSPTGDYLAAYEIAKRIAQQTGAYCLPVIPFGYSEYFRGFPGTISFSPQTMIHIIHDICECLLEHNISRIVFINGHAGNAPLIDQVARVILREKKIRVGSLDLWQSLTVEFKKELYGADFNPSGHGAEPVTSVMMYLFPDDIRLDLLTKAANHKEWAGLPIVNMTKVEVKDTQANVYFNMEELSPIGVLGNPYAASAERGKAIVSKIVEYGVSFVEKFKTAKTRLG